MLWVLPRTFTNIFTQIRKFQVHINVWFLFITLDYSHTVCCVASDLKYMVFKMLFYIADCKKKERSFMHSALMKVQRYLFNQFHCVQRLAMNLFVKVTKVGLSALIKEDDNHWQRICHLHQTGVPSVHVECVEQCLYNHRIKINWEFCRLPSWIL